MQYDFTDILGEVLGRPVERGFDPAAHDYRCPFIGRRCTKRSTSLGSEPYPVCSIRRRIAGELKQVCVCPKRFYSVDLMADVIDKCWPGNPPSNPMIASEVRMAGFGNVDFVIADIGQGEEVTEFLSVEVQAIDITGSVMPAYEALREVRGNRSAAYFRAQLEQCLQAIHHAAHPQRILSPSLGDPRLSLSCKMWFTTTSETGLNSCVPTM